jgi:hypothetical protein
VSKIARDTQKGKICIYAAEKGWLEGAIISTAALKKKILLVHAYGKLVQVQYSKLGDRLSRLKCPGSLDQSFAWEGRAGLGDAVPAGDQVCGLCSRRSDPCGSVHGAQTAASMAGLVC